MKALFGLVMCGGLSSRMGTDKAKLSYYGKEQRYYLYELLSQLCTQVFLSCQIEQVKDISEEYRVITDNEKYKGIGPMGGLLSAFDKFPNASFLVAACDYPFLDETHLHKLKDFWLGEDVSISYFNTESGFREPLLAIYDTSCYSALLKQFEEGKHSLRHFLEEINACKIMADTPDVLTSVDTYEDYLKILSRLR